MSIHAKIFIDDEEHNVLNFNFDLQKGKDAKGKPTTKFTGGIFNFVIEATGSSNILDWNLNPTLMKNVKLVISSNHFDSKSRTLELGDAYCLKFANDFDATGNEPMKEYFTVSPGYLIQNGTIIFEKYWKVTDLNAENVEETIIEEDDTIETQTSFD